MLYFYRAIRPQSMYIWTVEKFNLRMLRCVLFRCLSSKRPLKGGSSIDGGEFSTLYVIIYHSCIWISNRDRVAATIAVVIENSQFDFLPLWCCDFPFTIVCIISLIERNRWKFWFRFQLSLASANCKRNVLQFTIWMYMAANNPSLFSRISLQLPNSVHFAINWRI